MPWIEVIEPDAAKGSLGEAYAEVEKSRGGVANVFKAQSLHPEAMRAHLALHMAVVYAPDGLPRRERELIGLVVSRENGCAYLLSHQADAFGRYVTEPGLVALVAADPGKAPLSPRERAIAFAAAEITHRPRGLAPGHLDALRGAGLKEREVLDVVLVASYFNHLTRVASALGASGEDVALPYRY